jgi:DNA processing protein
MSNAHGAIESTCASCWRCRTNACSLRWPTDRREAIERAHEAFDPQAARRRLDEVGQLAVCRHHEQYPRRLLDGADAPAVLHVAGDPQRVVALARDEAPAVAVVGARRAAHDGIEVARGLGRGLAAAGVTVVSGMALGIDAAAHAGALEVGGPTIAVLAGGADVPYPPSKRALYRAIVQTQAAVSEMPPGFKPFRWCFRNLSGHGGCPCMTVSGEFGAVSSCCAVLPQRDRCLLAACGLT